MNKRFHVAFLALFLLGSLVSCGGDDTGADNPSFILISLDTARADHLGLYGYDRNTTPRLDALASEGLVFGEAVTVSENTLISHTSMLTGLFPGAHGTHYKDNGTPLLKSYDTIAEDFAEAGYQTAAFAAHKEWLNPRFGLDQGFEVFKTGHRSADVVISEAKSWLSERDSSRPFFLFVHLFDIHSDPGPRPYDAVPPFAGKFTRNYEGSLEPWDKQAVGGSRFLKAVMDGEIEITEEDLEYLRGQYDEGLAYTDDRLGRFVDSLAPRENLFILITADHGEEFMEHGKMLHSSLHEPVVHVPLILLPPPSEMDRLRAPRRIEDQVRIVDIRPTLLALAGLQAPRGCQGVDLLPWLVGRTDKCPSGPAPLYYQALRYGGYKMMRIPGGARLFDLSKDKGEKEDLSNREEMKSYINTMVTFLKKQKEEDEAIRKVHLKGMKAPELDRDPEAEARLREIGY